MSKVLYDWECPSCGHTFEALASWDTRETTCPECMKTTKRVMPAPRIGLLQMGHRHDASPEAIDHFDKLHRQQRAIEERYEREHGDYGPAPGAD